MASAFLQLLTTTCASTLFDVDDTANNWKRENANKPPGAATRFHIILAAFDLASDRQCTEKSKIQKKKKREQTTTTTAQL